MLLGLRDKVPFSTYTQASRASWSSWQCPILDRHACFLPISTKSHPRQTRELLGHRDKVPSSTDTGGMLNCIEVIVKFMLLQYFFFFLIATHASWPSRQNPILDRQTSFLVIIINNYPQQTPMLLAHHDKVPSSTDTRVSSSSRQTPILDRHENFLVIMTKSHPQQIREVCWTA